MTQATHAPVDVQTSAQAAEPDLFAEDKPEPAQAVALLDVPCRLLADAEVRTQRIGDGPHTAPVLCLRAQAISGARQVINAEQVFTETTRELAIEKAAGLKRGATVRIRTPVDEMEIRLPHVQSIHTLS